MASSRSLIIDYTYQQVASLVAGQREGTRPEQIKKILETRLDKLRKVYEPFDKPSDASKKLVESGSVTLPDGVKIDVEDADKEVVFAISDRFQIDQVDALVLLRSFLYNEGLPQTPDSDSRTSLIEELLASITPFYYSERLNVARTLVALVHCRQNTEDPFHKDASALLPKIVSDPILVVKQLIAEFLRKAKLQIPEKASSDPKSASHWAKQNAKEQLVLVEVIFWMLWDYVPCTASIVVSVFEAAYEVDFGYKQENSTSLLDDEGMQIQRDVAALWILITIEVLNLESLFQNGLELSSKASDNGPLNTSPSSLEKVHRLVMAHTSSGYVCTMLAWGFYLKGVSHAASLFAERPAAYVPFLKEIRASSEVSFKKGEKELHATIVAACLQPESGLFAFLFSVLTQSPLFVSSIAWKTGSSVTDPDVVAYRALIKGMVICLLDYEPVELIPDFDGFVEVWIALFGSSDSESVASLCRQYWDMDWRINKARRAIIDVARSRFPIQFRPLVRLLHSLTGSVHTDSTDPQIFSERSLENDDQRECANYVFHYFLRLPTYTQVISASARTGANSLYDRTVDRPGPSSSSGWAAYTNLRPVVLPGGSLLPQKSIGRLLCSDSSSEPVVVSWQHEHSGWRVLVDVLLDYVNRKQGSRIGTRRGDSSSGRKLETVLRLDDIGIERDSNDVSMTADALELILSVIQNNAHQAEQLIQSLEDTVPSSQNGANAPPDLVQLIFMILEDALSSARSNRSGIQSALVAPALGILSALLSLQGYSSRVWLYLRSTTMLFGSERNTLMDSSILASERASGRYVMTLALLRLVRTLLEEAAASLLVTQAEQSHLQDIKEEVLLRALRFVHGQIWVEHSSWRYSRLVDRFEIGRGIILLYSRIIQTMSAVTSANTFSGLSDFATTILISQATLSTITPLVHIIASGRSILATLAKLRRFSEVHKYSSLLEACLRVTRLALYVKSTVMADPKPTLLEQSLCSDHSINNILMRVRSTRVNPVDIVAHYVKERELGQAIPLEAIRTLTALCNALSTISPTPSIIGFFSDAQATVSSLAKILRHPYDDLPLRNAVWNFVCTAVEKQSAFSVLLVSGKFRIRSSKGKGKVKQDDGHSKDSDPFFSTSGSASVVEAASETLGNWKELWDANPQLLASVMSFLAVVWSRDLEHITTTLETTRGDSQLWTHLSAILKEELGPAPSYSSSKEVELDDGHHSDLHDAVSSHAYRIKTKSLALRIIGSDVAMSIRSSKAKEVPQVPSFNEIASLFKSEATFSNAITEAMSCSYDPDLYERIGSLLGQSFTPLTIESLRSTEPASEREFGDNFALSTFLLHDVLRSTLALGGEHGQLAEQLQFSVYSANLNLSLATAQLLLTESWCYILENVKDYLRKDPGTRSILLATAQSTSNDISKESRSGDFMWTVHGSRLHLLLALLEAAWFTPSEIESQTKSSIVLLENVGKIIANGTFPPSRSFLRAIPSPVHQTLLQIIYFCARNCHNNEIALNAKVEYRSLMGRTFTAVLVLIIDGLRLTFDSARTRIDLELDKDMELLVAVFQQCTLQNLHTSSTAWLTRCQETDVINASLKLFAQVDISGFSDLSLLRSHGRPPYALHVLYFHMVLASIPFTAERLASESVIAVYCNNSITTALSDGVVDVTLSELPGERSPIHKAYCLMLANVTGIISSLASSHHFIESQIVGFVQLYGKQLSRALSWSNDDTLTLPLLEELELTVELFYLMANGSAGSSRRSSTLSSVLQAFTEHALHLLQQLNYALTHPKHLTGLLEPISADERVVIDREMTNISVNALNELLNADKYPFLMNAISRLFGIAANVVSTLSVLGGAETVLLSDIEEWPLRDAIVIPHSKVTMGEPASIGTLLELGNCSFETLRFLTEQKLPLISKPAIKKRGNPGVLLRLQVRQTLESVLIYASTQLVMWLTKHEGEQTGDLEMDDQQQPEAHGFGHRADNTGVVPKDRERDRHLKRKSLSLADRLRRGMTGEMTMDLQGIITRAKPIVAKNSDLDGLPSSTDLMPVLATFLEQKVNAQ